jgi:hypothetical protein
VRSPSFIVGRAHYAGELKQKAAQPVNLTGQTIDWAACGWRPAITARSIGWWAMFGVVPRPCGAAPPDDRNQISWRYGRSPSKNPWTHAHDCGAGDKMPPKRPDIYGMDRARNLDHALADAGRPRRRASVLHHLLRIISAARPCAWACEATAFTTRAI